MLLLQEPCVVAEPRHQIVEVVTEAGAAAIDVGQVGDRGRSVSATFTGCIASVFTSVQRRLTRGEEFEFTPADHEYLAGGMPSVRRKQPDRDDGIDDLLHR